MSKDFSNDVSTLKKAFMDIDQVAEDLIRLIGKDPRYASEARSALTRIMAIKQALLADALK